MLGRTADLHLYAQPEAVEVFGPVLDYFCRNLSYNVVFHSFDPELHETVYEDRTMRVSTIPLRHRVPCAGFLVEEKPQKPHIIREMIDFYRVPLCRINAIKGGADFVTPDGQTILNNRLTRPASPARKYAYCSDTAYYESIIPIIQGVDVLYHEATYAGADGAHAEKYFHSSAAQAAAIARAAGVKRLILGHFSARYPDEAVLVAEAREVFANTQAADDGMRIEV
jgi:ribonuclease Z